MGLLIILDGFDGILYIVLRQNIYIYVLAGAALIYFVYMHCQEDINNLHINNLQGNDGEDVMDGIQEEEAGNIHTFGGDEDEDDAANVIIGIERPTQANISNET